MEAEIYNKAGESKGTVKLPEALFGAPWNNDLVHQVVVSMQSNARVGTAHTKDRSEVRGGGKKPWRQKGTGRARHGSRRSPIWVGGGVTHGPRNEKDYSKKINKKMKLKALASVLSKKHKDGQVLFVDSFGVAEPKTKEAVSFLKKISGIKGFEAIGYRKNASFIVVPEKDEATSKSFANIGSVMLDEVRNLNPLNILNNKVLVVIDPVKSIAILEDRIGTGGVKKVKKPTEKKVSEKTETKKKKVESKPKTKPKAKSTGKSK